MKMDVIPGRVNHFEITPDARGHLRRQVRRALRRLPLPDALQRRGRQRRRSTTRTSQELEDAGATSEQPLLGGEYASTQAGLESGDESEEGAE